MDPLTMMKTPQRREQQQQRRWRRRRKESVNEQPPGRSHLLYCSQCRRVVCLFAFLKTSRNKNYLLSLFTHMIPNNIHRYNYYIFVLFYTHSHTHIYIYPYLPCQKPPISLVLTTTTTNELEYLVALVADNGFVWLTAWFLLYSLCCWLVVPFTSFYYW